MEKTNWGIIGCGDVTELKSGPAFNKVPDSELVAIMRRDAAKAADYAARHHVPAWYSDADELINDPRVNAIYIATPPSSHKEYCLRAFNAGKPVYVEKPMALNEIEAQEMVAAAEKRHLKLAVAHYRREQPKFKKIKQLINEKTIGDIRFCRLVFLRPSLSASALEVPKTAWRVTPGVSGGGLFHDLAPHQLDLLFYFFGSMRGASGIATNQSGSYAAADFVTGFIEFDAGIVFNGLWSFAATPGQDADQCEIVGTKGKISFSVFDSQSFSLTVGGQSEVYSFEPLVHVQLPMIRKVVAYFQGKEDNPCSGTAAAEVMRAMDAFTSNSK